MRAFFRDEILGMQWLSRLIRRLLSLTGLDMEGAVGSGLQFFLYDSVKILILLTVLIGITLYSVKTKPAN